MSHCRVASAWFYDEGGESWGALIEQDYPGLGLQDKVAANTIPPTPNLGVFESKAGGGLVNQIIADPNFGEGAILTTHDNEAQTITQSRLDAITAYLQTLGMSEQMCLDAIGTTPMNRTNWEVSQSLISWLKTNN